MWGKGEERKGRNHLNGIICYRLTCKFPLCISQTDFAVTYRTSSQKLSQKCTHYSQWLIQMYVKQEHKYTV